MTEEDIDTNFKVPVTRILEINPHPNPKVERLSIAKVFDYDVIIGKGSYEVNQPVIYCPIASIIPHYIEEILFPPDSKIKLEKSRIRAIRIQGFVSQGMLILPSVIIEGIEKGLTEDKYSIANTIIYGKVAAYLKRIIATPEKYLNEDLQELLGIKKYKPPETVMKVGLPGQPKERNKNGDSVYFRKYNGCTNIKWCPDLLQEGVSDIYITEKLHGCVRFDTTIQFVDGRKLTIKEIVDNNIEGEIWGVDEKTNSLIPSKIINWFNNGYSDNWYKVTFSNTRGPKGNHYRSIYVTPNHQFYLADKHCYISVTDLKIDDTVLSFRDDYQISYINKEILTGILLGDGSLNKNAITYGHKKDHAEYMKYIDESLGEISGNEQKSVLSGYGTIMLRGRTKAFNQIGDIFESWYLTEEKQIPESIILSPISLAFWYMDDGSLSHAEGQEDRVTFATCGFNDESINNLISAFEKINIIATPYKDTDNYNRIRLNADEAEKMFLYIAPYIPKCMQYKLPERYRNMNCIHFPSLTGKFKPKLIEQRILSVEPYTNHQNSYNVKYDLETESHNYIANNVVVHNSSWRAYNGPTEVRSFWQRIKKFFGLLPKYTFYYGSNNVQLHNKPSTHKGFYKENHYLEMVNKYDIRNKLLPNEMVFAELIGGGNSIQKNYNYGLKDDEKRIVVFDLMYQDGKTPRWATLAELKAFCVRTGLEMVPILYEGKWNRKLAESFVSGVSVYSKEQKVREGIVIKSIDSDDPATKVKLKWINPEYLLKEASGETTDTQ